MCFGPPASRRVSRHRPPSLRMSPPRIVAALNLQKPGERQAMDALHRYTTGPRAIWRVLAMRRDADALRAAVEWPRHRAAPWFSLVTIGFADGVIDCRFMDTATAARAALLTAAHGGAS